MKGSAPAVDIVTSNRDRGRRRQRRKIFWLTTLFIVMIAGIGAAINVRSLQKIARYAPQTARGIVPGYVRRVPVHDKVAAKIVNAAHAQIGTHYDAAYRQIAYPSGDVESDKGACTDVVVRALRGAGFDLQKLMHEDMKRNFRKYPGKWGLSRPDPNIDHRRVPNQMKYFSRFGQTLTTRVNASTLTTWQPGDIVCWDMQNGQLHTGVISDGVNRNGVPLVIHNGWFCIEDDSLTRWKIIGHYRYPKRIR